MLKNQLQSDLTASMRERDALKSSTLRMVLAAITNEEVAGKVARELSDQEVMTVINREAKKRKESASAFDDANRPELADKERAELAIISTYLPEALGADEVAEIISNAIAAAAAEGKVGMAAMGVVMKSVTAQTTGRADGGEVAAAVKAALAN